MQHTTLTVTEASSVAAANSRQQTTAFTDMLSYVNSYSNEPSSAIAPHVMLVQYHTTIALSVCLPLHADDDDVYDMSCIRWSDSAI